MGGEWGLNGQRIIIIIITGFMKPWHDVFSPDHHSGPEEGDFKWWGQSINLLSLLFLTQTHSTPPLRSCLHSCVVSLPKLLQKVLRISYCQCLSLFLKLAPLSSDPPLTKLRLAGCIPSFWVSTHKLPEFYKLHKKSANKLCNNKRRHKDDGWQQATRTLKSLAEYF